ncbi:MAG: PAS domain S-box protein [Anaerolineae bacterium]|nr:PAS domain S-box protein [Anaerolineae bacterium]
MCDTEKTKEQLIQELADLRQQLADRARAEEAQRESENRFQAAFRTSPDAININRLSDGMYVDINDGFTALTGFTAEDVFGKTSADINIWVDRTDRERLVQGLKEHGEVVDLEAQFRFKDGGVGIGLMSARIIRFGGEMCILSITRNITERKRLEDESRNAAVMRAELQKEKEILALKEQFIATISHEFRTPLAVIKTSNDLLSQYYDRLAEDRRRELFHQIDQQIKDMIGLINDTLDFTRAQAGKTEVNRLPLDLGPFCRAIVDQFQFTNDWNHRLEYTGNPPEQPVSVDKRLLQHILTNLLSNAAKYTPDDARICFELDHTASEVIFRISDEGIGIPESDQARLFDPFYRAANVDAIKGSGLGLAIVKQYVDMHGGRIEVESQEGRGSTFSVLLPNA